MSGAGTRWLVLRLSAPMMSFGAVAIDQVGPTARWPGASMLTGLIGNALGWDWDDRAAHQTLQDRLRFGAMEMRAATGSRTSRMRGSAKPIAAGRPEGRQKAGAGRATTPRTAAAGIISPMPST